jgi:Flp pilus assembly protein CpaB
LPTVAPARRVLARRSVAVVLASAVTLAVTDRLQQAEGLRDDWGASTTVLVARVAVEPGQMIRPDQLTPRRWPAAVVPAGAIRHLSTPVRARHPILAGDALRSAHLSETTSALAAQLDPGRSAVRVPVVVAVPELRAGDRVDVVAAADPFGAGSVGIGSAEAAPVLTRDARVLAVGDQAVTLSVADRDGPATASVAAGSGVALVVRR